MCSIGIWVPLLFRHINKIKIRLKYNLTKNEYRILTI